MSEARIVIDYIQEQRGINLDTLIDKDFSQFSWLIEREPILNEQGERVSKSYFTDDKYNKEAIRIEYHKIIGDYEFEGTIYPNTFLGLGKDFHWLRWDGTIGKSKSAQKYLLNLLPIYENEIITGFTSLMMRKILAEEQKGITI